MSCSNSTRSWLSITAEWRKTLTATSPSCARRRRERRRMRRLVRTTPASTKRRPTFLKRSGDCRFRFVAHQPVNEVFQRERLPVRCFWSPLYSGDGPNQTRQGQAIKNDPLVGHLLLAATKVEGELVRLQREEAAAEKKRGGCAGKIADDSKTRKMSFCSCGKTGAGGTDGMAKTVPTELARCSA